MHSRWNIQTQCYLFAADSLGLSYIDSLIHNQLRKKWMRLYVTVVQRSLKLVPIGEARKQITIVVHYCDAHYAYLLSFPRYYDLLIKNLHFYRFYSPHFRLKPPQRSYPWDLWHESCSINKLEVHGLSIVRNGEHRMRIRLLVLTYYHCVLDRQTNGQMHVIMPKLFRHNPIYGVDSRIVIWYCKNCNSF